MKVLVNVRCIDCVGGVANFYKILALNENPDISYFTYNIQKKKLFKLIRFIKVYIDFFFDAKKFDIIHLNPSLGRTAIWRDLLFLIIAKLLSKKVVVFIHGWDLDYEKKIRQSIILSRLFLIYNKVDAFFVSGTIFKTKLLEMNITKEKLFFLETMIADDRYIKSFDMNKRIQDFKDHTKPIKFLFISRITTGKGMNLAIDIFNILQKKHNRQLELLIAGDGDKLQETKNYVTKNNIENVIFTGYVKDNEKHKLLCDCDITLFPTSYGEGIPNTVLEGMLYGMPIISRINAGIPDWVINNENGFVTESTTPDDYVPFIEKLISDPELFSRIAINNNKKAIDNFTKAAIRKRFPLHYQEILDK